MHIAGGLYRETCLVPEWNAEYGSGGRAAAAVAGLSPATVLHAYAPTVGSIGQDALERLGVELRLQRSSHGIAVAYFHPLSTPHIEPRRAAIVRHAPIEVSGEAVLRFGFLEGEAVVHANRAVYDPQTSVSPATFADNGSCADELALVLNEAEARALSGRSNLHEAAAALLQPGAAHVVIVKGGARGALVVERGGATVEIPAYRSERVFKIGTGDVFSSVFALEWAERKQPAFLAAERASRSVAAYCATGKLPLTADAQAPREPVALEEVPAVLLDGVVDTIGRRFVMEEARSSLLELGARVACPALDGVSATGPASIRSALVIGEGLSGDLWARLQGLESAGIPVVLLDELRATGIPSPSLAPVKCRVTDDFTSAIYFALWATSSQRG
jgi:hypothetical protein